MNTEPPAPSDDEPPSAVETHPAGEVVPAHSSWWYRIGGGSLTVSMIIHAIVILIAILIVRTVTTVPPETVDFLPGGGGGGKGSAAKIAEKRRAVSMSVPKTRTVSSATNSAVSLPDLQTSMSDFSNLTSTAAMGGGIGGGSGGLSGSGSGGMMGNGRGTGIGPGIGRGFVGLPLFGTKIDARRMAVVLDMSGSMYPYLPIVIKEVDKVAPGSMVILHYGCGLSDAEVRKPSLEFTTDKEFDEDRIVTSLLESATAAMSKSEREALLALVKKRPKTFFVPSTNVGTTWVALTDSKLKDVDAIYWFADFADGLSKDRLEEVGQKLRSRKQKLYIHPSNPKWLEGGDPLAINVAKVENEIVKPTGGKVLKVEIKKDVPVKEDAKPKPKPAG